jgi:hypothetical protein
VGPVETAAVGPDQTAVPMSVLFLAGAEEREDFVTDVDDAMEAT